MSRSIICALLVVVSGGVIGFYLMWRPSPPASRGRTPVSADLDRAFRATLAQIEKDPAALAGYAELARLVEQNPTLYDLSERMLPILIPALNERNPRLQMKAMTVLMHLTLHRSESTHSAYATLAAIATDQRLSSEVRSYAVDVIGFMAHQDLQPILPVLSDADPLIRGNAIYALGRTGRADQAVAILIAALKDADSGVRSSAALALATRGPQARSAFRPLLEASIADPDERVRSCAAGAMRNIDRELFERISR